MSVSKKAVHTNVRCINGRLTSVFIQFKKTKINYAIGRMLRRFLQKCKTHLSLPGSKNIYFLII